MKLLKDIYTALIKSPIRKALRYPLLLCILFFSFNTSGQTAADFTISKVSGCAPLSSVNFTDNSTGGVVAQRSWDLGNGLVISNGPQMVGTNYLTAQTYYITLTVTFSNGDIKTKKDSVTVYPKPVADFKADDTAGCIPRQVNFTDLSSTATGAINSWTWDLGAGGSTSQDPAFLYNTAGNYNVSLIVKNNWGCESEAASKFKYIHVYKTPVASFIPSATISCNDTFTVQFNNTTSGGSTANKYRWDFGDGDTSTAKDPTHFYRADGTYIVTLTVLIGKNCSSTATDTIYNGKVAPFFISPPDTVCNNTSIQFSGSATPLPYYVKWLFSDDSSVQFYSPTSHIFASPGNYTISLIAYNYQGCSDTINKLIRVKAGAGLTPFFITAPDTVCVNSSIQFDGSSRPAPALLKWAFSDNSTIQDSSPTSHVFASSDDYTVSLIAYNAQGCADTISKPVHARTGPLAGFTPQKVNGCAIPFSVSFTNNSPAVPNLAFTWDFGDKSPLLITHSTLPVMHTYTDFGNYTITLSARDTIAGCVGTTDTFSYIKIVQPDVNFSYVPPNGCLPLPVSFTAQVNNLIVPVTNYIWNYGDGSKNDTSATPLVTHTFLKSGIFNCTLTILTAECTYTSIANQVTVISICDDDGSGGGSSGGAGFIVEKNCADKYSVKFTDTVSHKIAESWDFGDGFTAPSLNPVTHPYSPAQKVYLVTVIRMDTITHVSDTGIKRMIIIDEKANFLPNVTAICNYSTASFKTIGIDSSKIKTYTWDFGDSSGILVINNAQNFSSYGFYLNGNSSHIYNKTGVFYVKLVIEDKLGCLDSFVYSTPVMVSGPVANFTPVIHSSCLLPIKVVFTDSSQPDGNITITNWQWSLGDGSSYYNTTVDSAFNHLYSMGSYSVSLDIKDAAGCTGTITKPLVVTIDSTGPRAAFTASPLNSCISSLPVSFTDTSILNGSIPISRWQWSFGDGKPNYTTNVDTPFTHIYTGNADANFFTPTLVVQDSAGCISALTQNNYIKIYRPHADFFSNDTLQCNTFNVFLYNYSSAYHASYLWDFGDGTTSTDFYGSHNYSGEGKYAIKLVVSDENGCKDSIIKPSYIQIVRPVAGFTVGDTTKCAPAAIAFSDSSQYASSYVWDFGDGGTGSTDQNPSPKIYASPGIYKVTLKITGLDNCVDSTFKLVHVPGPVATITAITGNGCKPYNINMKVSGSFISTYAWDYNDGTPVNPSSVDSVVLHTYDNAGKYIPNVVVTSPEGCPFTLRAPDTIIVDAARAAFVFDNNTFCDSGYVTFTNQSTTSSFSALKYHWDFGDGTADTLENPSPHLYNVPGRYTVKLIVSSKYGCVDSLEKTNAIIVNASPVAVIAGDSIKCIPGLYQYLSSSASIDSITTYQWYVDDIQQSNARNLSYYFNDNHLISLKISTNNGCTDSVAKGIIVDSVKAGFRIINPKICGDTGTVRFTNLSVSRFGNVTYAWDFGDGQTSTAASPSHFYSTAANYLVTLKANAANGCSDTFVSADTVKIYSAPVVTIVGDNEKCMQSILQYSSVIVSDDSITSYTWLLSNNRISTGKAAFYHFVNAGTYTLSLTVSTLAGCIATAAKTIIIDPLPIPNAGPDTALCSGAAVQLHSADGTAYQWDPAATLQNSNTSNPIATPTTTTNYYVLVTNQYGCLKRDTVIIKVDPQVNLIVSNNDSLCSGQKVQLFANANASSYLWSPAAGLNNVTIANPVASPATTTTYMVIAYSGNLCKNDTGYVTVAAGNPPVVNAGSDINIASGTPVQLHATVNSNDVSKYLWSPSTGLSCTNCADPQFIADNNITYTVTVQTIYGCTASDDVKIFVFCGKGQLYIPNAFTPNGDGLNDRFYIRGYGLSSIKSLQIFNRWGQKVFEKKNAPVNDPSYGWDGLVKGESIEETSAFVYILDVICKDGQEFTLNGTVMLIR